MSFNFFNSVARFANKLINECNQIFNHNSQFDLTTKQNKLMIINPVDKDKVSHKKVKKTDPIRSVVLVLGSTLAGGVVFLTNVNISFNPNNSVAGNSNKTISQSELTAMIDNQSKVYPSLTRTTEINTNPSNIYSYKSLSPAKSAVGNSSVLFNSPTVKVSFGGEVSQAWVKDIIKTYGGEKALDWCFQGGCADALTKYANTGMRNRMIQSEANYILNNQKSPSRKNYEQKTGFCPSNDSWMNHVRNNGI